MKSLIMKFMTLLALLSSFMKTPMSLMSVLLMQTTLSMIFMIKIYKSSWYAMITFLMMIGGIMIIFMYMTSITSNDKFKWNFKLILMFLISMLIVSEDSMNEMQMNDMLKIYSLMDQVSMSNLYNKMFLVMINLTLYLLLTMISINKIIKNFEGPLRTTKIYEQKNIKKKQSYKNF